MSDFTFFLGTHMPSWLATVEVPLFVSHVRLRERKTLPKRLPGAIWALDSGAFSEISKYGQFLTEAEEYVAKVRWYRDEIGGMAWASPMDWMCEPNQLAKTGLPIEEHQARSVASVLELRAMAPDLPFIPVLQGWDLASYLRCMDLYAKQDVDLAAEPVVGLGSVCRRQGSDEIGQIVTVLADDYGLKNLHGFGVKKQGVQMYGTALLSSDSMAWSTAGRYEPPCIHGSPAKNEANCLEYALAYRADVLASINAWRQPMLAA